MQCTSTCTKTTTTTEVGGKRSPRYNRTKAARDRKLYLAIPGFGLCAARWRQEFCGSTFNPDSIVQNKIKSMYLQCARQPSNGSTARNRVNQNTIKKSKFDILSTHTRTLNIHRTLFWESPWQLTADSCSKITRFCIRFSPRDWFAPTQSTANVCPLFWKEQSFRLVVCRPVASGPILPGGGKWHRTKKQGQKKK